MRCDGFDLDGRPGDETSGRSATSGEVSVEMTLDYRLGWSDVSQARCGVITQELARPCETSAPGLTASHCDALAGRYLVSGKSPLRSGIGWLASAHE
jgi:hypothetical protein